MWEEVIYFNSWMKTNYFILTFLPEDIDSNLAVINLEFRFPSSLSFAFAVVIIIAIITTAHKTKVNWTKDLLNSESFAIIGYCWTSSCFIILLLGTTGLSRLDKEGCFDWFEV